MSENEYLKKNQLLKVYSCTDKFNTAIFNDFRDNPKHGVKLNSTLKFTGQYFYKLSLTNKFNFFSDKRLNSHLKLNMTKGDYIELSNENTNLVLTMKFNTSNLAKGSEFSHNISFDKLQKEFTNYSLNFKTPSYGTVNLHITHRQDKEPSAKLKYSVKKIYNITNLSVRFDFNYIAYIIIESKRNAYTRS
jgi:hypothetical protein